MSLIPEDHHEPDHYLGLLALEDEPLKKGKKKRDRRDSAALRKAPNAPKRFRSSYICFFMAKQSAIKEELGNEATVASISKRSAEMWKSLPPDERLLWDEIAVKDKKRYMIEKAKYTGPWQVPRLRVKKDPSAPRRPMSAFLLFTQGKRSQIRKENPDIKNTEVSRILGELWRNLSDEERSPHVEKEKIDREKYKLAMAAWREEHEAKQQADRKAQVEQAEVAAGMPETEPFATQQAPMANPYAFPNYQLPYQLSGAYQFPINGKQPVLLGPNGTPYMNQPGLAALMAQQPMQVAPPMFDDGTGHHHYDYGRDTGSC